MERISEEQGYDLAAWLYDVELLMPSKHRVGAHLTLAIFFYANGKTPAEAAERIVEARQLV